jgi:uncharacterized C2H2 Zn-finger protein
MFRWGMSSGEWSGEDEFECPVCGTVFEDEDELREHSQSEHPNREEH